MSTDIQREFPTSGIRRYSLLARRRKWADPEPAPEAVEEQPEEVAHKPEPDPVGRPPLPGTPTPYAGEVRVSRPQRRRPLR